VVASNTLAEYGYGLVLDLSPLVPLDPLMALLESERLKERAAPPDPATPPQARAQTAQPDRKVAARSITIAIDPGHGGEDPGAIGRRGTYEKNVVLAIARTLKARIDAEPH